MDEIRDLLRLWDDSDRSSSEVKALTLGHVAELEKRIGLLQEMRDTLTHLAEACDGDHRPHCPIIKSLATGDDLPDLKGRLDVHENLAHRH
jgi:MerR family copper efflux transcriptional regulator